LYGKDSGDTLGIIEFIPTPAVCFGAVSEVVSGAVSGAASGAVCGAVSGVLSGAVSGVIRSRIRSRAKNCIPLIYLNIKLKGTLLVMKEVCCQYFNLYFN
jgi:uncharacterized protein YsxB (DUF464 family)